MCRILPPIGIVMFCIGYGLGFGPVTFNLLGEIFPTRVRGIGTSITMSTRCMSIFVFLKLYPATIGAFGMHGLFMMHSLFCGLAVVFYSLCIPETKGLTLSQVEKLFMSAKDKAVFEQKEAEAANMTVKPPTSIKEKADVLSEIKKGQETTEQLFNKTMNRD